MTVSFYIEAQIQMRKTKIRVEKVSLEELKKILPETVLNGNNNDNQKNKKENRQRVAKTSKPKSKA
jgi:hypothetical protein